MFVVNRLCAMLLVVILVASTDLRLVADDSKQEADTTDTQNQETATEDFEISSEVQEILSPLFVAIKNAEVSRATIEVLSDSLMAGRVVESKKSVYQIASRAQNKFTIYWKEPSQRTRIYSDGTSAVVALAPDAYFRLPEPISNAEAMLGLPVPMGPYPEPVLALTLAGVDPAASLLDGMKSIELIDEKKFRGKTPAVHLHGVQADAVTWDLWLTKDETPTPIRLLVDLTPMLLASPELKLPRGYSHQLRFDFLSWRVTGKVEDSLFTFKPAENATEYESIEDYNRAVAAAAALPPLLGKNLPEFEGKTLSGKTISSADLEDKIAVIDFWTSWHKPCAEILPTIKKVCDQFADQGVIFIALNVREEEKQIRSFLKEQELDIPVVIDPQGSISESFKIQAVPQTVVVGKNGKVESVHLGYPGKESLTQRLTDELEVLSVGGHIATVSDKPDEDDGNTSASSRQNLNKQPAIKRRPDAKK